MISELLTHWYGWVWIIVAIAAGFFGVIALGMLFVISLDEKGKSRSDSARTFLAALILGPPAIFFWPVFIPLAVLAGLGTMIRFAVKGENA